MRAIAAELLARGHGVRVVGPQCRRQSYEGLGARFEAYEHAPEHDAGAPETDLIRDWEARTPLGAFARMRDNLMFGPAMAFAREVDAAVERERPAGAVIDYMLTGAAAGARRAGVPAAGLVHNVYPLPAEGVPPFGMGLAPARGQVGRLRDRVLGRVALRPFAVGLNTLNGVRRELGLPEVARLGALLDDFAAVLVAVPPEFDLAARAPLSPGVTFVGHMAPPAPEQSWRGPWPSDDPRPLVVVSLSTTFMDQRGLAVRIIQALGGMPVRALFTVGPAPTAPGPAHSRQRGPRWIRPSHSRYESGVSGCHPCRSGHGGRCAMRRRSARVYPLRNATSPTTPCAWSKPALEFACPKGRPQQRSAWRSNALSPSPRFVRERGACSRPLPATALARR